MPPMDRLSAALADRYRIERELGAGGMATVYLAHDLRHDRDVAIKVLHPDLGAALGGERFLSEIRTTARLQHPHILPLLDSGEADGLLYYVMPVVTGETLRARLERERQLPIPEAVRLAREVAGALDYAHRQGVIHRDIKPENILLHDGSALVADFGIALAVQTAGGQRMTQTGLSLGTPQYMSPEQAMGERTIDARTDVYALGAVTYEMLTGDAPFSGNSVQAIVAKVLNERPTPPTTLRDTVPVAVEEAVLTALAKLPADRFATAAEFGAALGADSGARAAARPAAVSPGRRRALVVAGVTLAALCVAGGWLLGERGRGGASGTASVAFEVTMPAEAHILASRRALAISPDGRTIAFVAERTGGQRMLYVRSLGGVAAVPLSGTEGAYAPFFSPDGAWVGFVATQQLRKVPVAGGPVVTLTEVSDTDGASWGADGLIVISNAGRLAVVAQSGGVLKSLEGSAAPPGRSERYPVVLRDGQGILYTDWGGVMTGARIMHRTLAPGPGTPIGVDDGASLGVVDGFLLVGGSGGVVGLVALNSDATHANGSLTPLVDQVAVTGSVTLAHVAGNGTLLYPSGSDLADLVLVGVRGDTTIVSPERKAFYDPRFSPDGTRIAVMVDGRQGPDIWVLDKAARSLTRLTTGGRGNLRPEWSPDGALVLFRSQRDSPAAYWGQRWDGGRPAERLYAAAGKDVWEANVSPDGKWLLYRVGTGATADLWVRGLSGDTTSRPFVATPATEVEARLSPDGRWVAYSSNESGVSEVYVRPFPSGDQRIQVSTGGGEQPVWSRDGRSLYFTGARGGVYLRAAVTTSPSLAVTARDTMLRGQYIVERYGHAGYDVAPDGAHLLLARPVSTTSTVVVEVGWLDRVRATLARGAGK